MKPINDDFVANYNTSKRLTDDFVELLKSAVDREFPGLRFHINSTADLVDNVEVEILGTEMSEAFNEQKQRVQDRILAIASHLWQAELAAYHRTKHATP